MKCQRCWGCCVDAANHKPVPELTRQFYLPWHWLQGISVRMCPFMGAEDGLPTCTVYEMRPNICRNYQCKRMKQ